MNRITVILIDGTRDTFPLPVPDSELPICLNELTDAPNECVAGYIIKPL